MSQPNLPTPKYRFYATLLDGFQDYLDAEENWNKYYGSSADPKLTIDEYAAQCRQELIDKINRVPFDSEAADKGTAFNEVVDCLIENRNSTKVTVTKTLGGDGSVTGLNAVYNGREFFFPIGIVREFSDYFKGALTQQYCEGYLRTRYGFVQVYGFIDELMPQSTHDIKTTSQYYAGKYRKHWQHIVYPYCLYTSGIDVRRFEYNVTDFRATYTEMYVFDPERDAMKLNNHCEWFIEFLEANKSEITNKKIFNLE